MDNCENLSEHCKNLLPLCEGDNVFIQNQNAASTHSNKWDKQGTVIATHDNDQYLIRVSGTGKLTLRNRRFLRKFKETNPYVADVEYPMMPLKALQTPHESTNHLPTLIHDSQVPSIIQNAQIPQQPGQDVVTPSVISTQVQREDNLGTEANASICPSIPSILVSTGEAPAEKVIRHSTRSIQTRKFYDAASGTYKKANS